VLLILETLAEMIGFCSPEPCSSLILKPETPLAIYHSTVFRPDGVQKSDVYQSTVLKNSRHMNVPLSDMHEEPVF
jgi:hypothetical protein